MKQTLLTVILMMNPVAQAGAQWQHNGVPILDTAANIGYALPQIVEDGWGGAIVCWRDGRNQKDLDIYAQRIDSNGIVQWRANGIPVCTAPHNQNFPKMISDDQGGAITVWEDARDNIDTRIYAQKLTIGGQVLWQQDGVKIAETSGIFLRPVSDGEGGAIVAWWRRENLSGHDQVVCQRVNRHGQRMWGDSGMVVISRKGDIPSGDIATVSDGKGGVIVAWVQDMTVFVQRADSLGNFRWNKTGVRVSNKGSSVSSSVFGVSDGRNGAFLNWFDEEGNNYAQRIDSTGRSVWRENGLLVAGRAFSGAGGGRRLLRDSAGGVFVGHGLRIQRLDSAGHKLWDTTGTVFTAYPSTNSVMVSDLQDGIINVWEGWIETQNNQDIFSQRINAAGQACWTQNGVRLVDALYLQRNPKAVSDRKGGVIVVWDDERSAEDPRISYRTSIYAQRISREGIATSIRGGENDEVVPQSPILEQNYPNPFNPETKIQFYLPRSGRVTITVVDILGRIIRTVLDIFEEPGRHMLVWDGTSDSGGILPSGIYFCRLQFEQRIAISKMIFLH